MKNAKFTYKDVAPLLIQEIPEFSDTYNEYLENDGQVLLHVLFGDLTRFLIAAYKEICNSANSEALFLRILDFVEEIYVHGDADVRVLVEASFLENLLQSGDDYQGIKIYLRENTFQQLKVMENWGSSVT